MHIVKPESVGIIAQICKWGIGPHPSGTDAYVHFTFQSAPPLCTRRNTGTLFFDNVTIYCRCEQRQFNAIVNQYSDVD